MGWQRRKGLLVEEHLLKIPWLEHFFTTSREGDLRDSKKRKKFFEKRKISFFRLVTAEQVHGKKVVQVEKKDLGKELKGVDGIYTKEERIPLGIFTADCLPVYLVDKKKKVIGLIHAGRKGIEKNILEEAFLKIKQSYYSEAKDFLVVVGPHIRACCYFRNLEKELKDQLKSLGVKKENIHLSFACTSCGKKRFFSYHRDKGKERMLAYLVKRRSKIWN
jgi:hypothetical protein